MAKKKTISVTTDEIPKYLDDEQAERIGRAIAEDFMLKPSREHQGGFETATGWFYPKGIARRAQRLIVEGLNPRA